MPKLTPETAKAMLDQSAVAFAVLKSNGRHLQYGYRYLIRKPHERHIYVASRPTEDGVTIYINKLSCALEEFPALQAASPFPGVTLTKEVPKGSVGRTGDKGIASGAASCPTLDPKYNDVLVLSCTDRAGFDRLLKWYAGELTFGASPGSREASESASDAAMSEIANARDAGVDSTKSSGLSDEVGDALDVKAESVSLPEEEELRQMADPERRRAVERHAEDIGAALYESLGFTVTRVGKPFDLLCVPTDHCAPGTPTVHVECKGSVGAAAKVHLTRNEVSDARNDAWRSDLFVVSNIRLELAGDNSVWRASGGDIRRFVNWRPDDSSLVPIDYEYTVPVEGAVRT